MHKYLFFFLFFSVLMMAQKNTNNSVKRFYYRDSVVSMERFTGKDKKLDSLKTYYSDGKLNEVFYYDEKGFMHSNCYQLNKEGEKLVTWNFLHGKLINRTDHKLPFNKVNEEKVKEKLQNLIELNQKTNYNPTSINDLCRRGNLRAGLGNTILALEDLKIVENYLNHISKNTTSSQSETVTASIEEFKSYLYDLMANVYLNLEMENYAVVYYLKAIATTPNDTRILYNFASSLEKKSTDLAIYYLEKVIATMPEHAFARLSISMLYSDKGEYQKAMENITIAFPKEKHIIELSTDYSGRDLRTTRGFLYHKLGESEKGIQDLKEALERDKNNSYAMKNLGIIYLEQQKYDEACKLFEKAKNLNYKLVFDKNDLDALLESACNRAVLPQETILTPKPIAYPNPATTSITIENYNFKNFEFEFFDFESNSILKGKSANTTIDITDLIPGFYILKIYNTDSPQTFNIIKE